MRSPQAPWGTVQTHHSIAHPKGEEAGVCVSSHWSLLGAAPEGVSSHGSPGTRTWLEGHPGRVAGPHG